MSGNLVLRNTLAECSLNQKPHTNMQPKHNLCAHSLSSIYVTILAFSFAFRSWWCWYNLAMLIELGDVDRTWRCWYVERWWLRLDSGSYWKDWLDSLCFSASQTPPLGVSSLDDDWWWVSIWKQFENIFQIRTEHYKALVASPHSILLFHML